MAGIEPATDGLRNRCSTAELHWLTNSKTCGNYFGRVRVNGKLIRHSLKTPVLSVAKLKLSDFLQDQAVKIEIVHAEHAAASSTEYPIALGLLIPFSAANITRVPIRFHCPLATRPGHHFSCLRAPGRGCCTDIG